LPHTVIPAKAGIQSLQSRGTRDWTPAFAGVTGGEKVIIFGNCYILINEREKDGTEFKDKRQTDLVFPGDVGFSKRFFGKVWTRTDED